MSLPGPVCLPRPTVPPSGLLPSGCPSGFLGVQAFPVVPAPPPSTQTLGKRASGSVPGSPVPHQAAQFPPVCPGILVGGAVSSPPADPMGPHLCSGLYLCSHRAQPTTRGRLGPSNDRGSPVAPGEAGSCLGGAPPSALLLPPGLMTPLSLPRSPALQWGGPQSPLLHSKQDPLSQVSSVPLAPTPISRLTLAFP